MSEPYLILHKVRGEPAFDVAIKLIADKTFLPDEEEIWIIPTSGHRAYPIWKSELFGLIDEGTGCSVKDGYLSHLMANMPEGWPDHYSCNDRPMTEDRYVVAERAKGLLEELGLVKKVEVERRF